MSTLLAQSIWWDDGMIASVAAEWESANRRRLKRMKPSQLRALLAQGKEATTVEAYEQRFANGCTGFQRGRRSPMRGPSRAGRPGS